MSRRACSGRGPRARAAPWTDLLARVPPPAASPASPCSKDVDFCGYSIPHPSEAVVNIRLQTRETPASDVLSAALTTLADMCDHVVETFDAATKEFDPSLVEEAEGGEEGEEA